MPTIKDLGDQWPFPAVNEAYKRGDDTWFRTTERIAWDLIESVPTVRCAGYEFMGEPFTHVDGYPVHCAIVRIGARYYLRHVPLKNDRVFAATSDLFAALRQGVTP